MTNRLTAATGPKSFRIRTITAGVVLGSAGDLPRIEAAGRFLVRARASFEAAGYEVQTMRAATQPLAEYAPEWAAEATVEAITSLDRLAGEQGLSLSIGPVIVGDEHDERFAAWAADLIRRTRNTSLSISVASSEAGVHRRSARTAAEAIAAIAEASADGEGNFRFAAAARVPAGTPFFPVAWFRDGSTFSLGLESAGLLQEVFASAGDREQAKRSLRRRLDEELTPLRQIARDIERTHDWRFLGIDVSPAPSPDASIGEAIETLTGAPFGDPSTLAGCAAITYVLHGLEVGTCGYSGLMLPMLEDKVLARRAAEGRFGVSDLLRYSSVCGTGLDVVPLPGDTSVEVLAALIEDVAALAVKHRKPLAARLLPIPGRSVGEVVRIDNPHLTDGVVMDPAC
jgi:uncharacterized protein (UPF0210 family)